MSMNKWYLKGTSMANWECRMFLQLIAGAQYHYKLIERSSYKLLLAANRHPV